MVMKKDQIYWLSLLGLILDQLIKRFVTKHLLLGKVVSIIPNFFALRYVQNTGAAWGIFGDSALLLSIVSAIFLIILNLYLSKETHFTKQSIIGYGLLIGGVLGNLVDRILHGYVIDFLDFNIINYNFPTFNFADILIVVGVFLIIIEIVRGEISGNRSRKRTRSLGPISK